MNIDESRIQKLEEFIGLRIAKATSTIKKAIEEQGQGDRLVYTLSDIASQCGLKVGTLRKEIKAGRLESFVKCNRALVTAEAFKAWLSVRDKSKPRGNYLERLMKKQDPINEEGQEEEITGEEIEEALSEAAKMEK